MRPALVAEVRTAVLHFIEWLNQFGETSCDHQTFFASDIGRKAKALYYTHPMVGTAAVAPLIFCEAFVPEARRFFWKKQRFPIADAHYAMGFAFLAELSGEERYYRQALHFLEVLIQTRSPGYARFGWGYPFDWETRHGTWEAGTPMITTAPYAYEAFRQVHALDRQQRWREIMRSIAQHAVEDYRDFPTSADACTCSYTPRPDDMGGVINANAYRAFLLTSAALDLQEERYFAIADKNIRFVIQSQNADGSWYYAMDGERTFVDHFHTCFVLKALAKIEALTPRADCKEAVDRGLAYYTANLFDGCGLPKPFSRAPRLTVYRRELYDYAECINLALLVRGRSQRMDDLLPVVVGDLLKRWRKPDHSFRSRELMLGWDNTPMHRWAQAQLFRSLCFLLAGQPGTTNRELQDRNSQLCVASADNTISPIRRR